MNIGVSGLGLIGGSIAKAFKKKTDYTVFGYDISEDAIHRAFLEKAIDSRLTQENIPDCDVIFLASYPDAAVNFIKANSDFFKKGSIIFDLCGIKRAVWNKVAKISQEKNFIYMGAHPMAGREYSEFTHFSASLFDNASMILTPVPGTSILVLEQVKKICIDIGFGGLKITTPEEHDSIIAFTSQLPHIISNAYIKSPSAEKQHGFSAGSFRDMSRISKLNEKLWTGLFLDNRDNLGRELDFFITTLEKYRDAIKNNDSAGLCTLLKEGRERKTMLDKATGKED